MNQDKITARKELNRGIGSALRTLRLLKGETQADLAEATGLSFQQIQKYEKGANRISAGMLYEFAVHYGVDVDYFFETAPVQDGVRARAYFRMLSLAQRLEELPEDIQLAIVDLVGALRKESGNNNA